MGADAAAGCSDDSAFAPDPSVFSACFIPALTCAVLIGSAKDIQACMETAVCVTCLCILAVHTATSECNAVWACCMNAKAPPK